MAEKDGEVAEKDFPKPAAVPVGAQRGPCLESLPAFVFCRNRLLGRSLKRGGSEWPNKFTPKPKPERKRPGEGAGATKDDGGLGGVLWDKDP
jgi:hypothetical protein